MRGPWTYKVKKRGGHGGQTVMFYFQGREFAERVWYPPWRNEQERDNAKCIVDDLNRAFKERNATPHGAASRKHPALRRRVRRPQWEDMHKLLEKP